MFLQIRRKAKALRMIDLNEYCQFVHRSLTDTPLDNQFIKGAAATNNVGTSPRKIVSFFQPLNSKL